jgi:hypothetical protein
MKAKALLVSLSLFLGLGLTLALVTVMSSPPAAAGTTNALPAFEIYLPLVLR